MKVSIRACSAAGRVGDQHGVHQGLPLGGVGGSVGGPEIALEGYGDGEGGAGLGTRVSDVCRMCVGWVSDGWQVGVVRPGYVGGMSRAMVVV